MTGVPTPPDRRLPPGPFLLAIAAGLALVVSAPVAGELRRWLRAGFPEHFLLTVGGAVGIVALAALAWALRGIRQNRGPRYLLLAGAVLVAIGYSQWSAIGNPDSDAVERMHFIEYGTVTWLFYRAWRPRGDALILAHTFLAALAVGALEEWFQWFIPARVGEIRDVLLNSAAIVSGLLFSLAVAPPAGLAWPQRSRVRSLGVTAAIASSALAALVTSAHLGFEIAHPTTGSFRSIYNADELLELDALRRREWALHPPVNRPPLVGREDQYASEALLHVRARNDASSRDDVHTAWFENAILERYFGVVLDTASYVSPTGHRWDEAQRENVRRQVFAAGRPVDHFRSRAMGDFPILLWPRHRFLAATAALVLLLLAWSMRGSWTSGR